MFTYAQLRGRSNSKTGHRYISPCEDDGRYRVYIRIKGFPSVSQYFTEIEDAIELRDTKLREWGLLAEEKK